MVRELKAATVLRALRSRRQLKEVMVEFWSNHFSVYHLDGAVAWLKTVEDREVIRRHCFGKFRDLLMASAKSPAMLVYLDNFVNTKAGPNENYARELMELHTLGVDGGFSQQDVEEVALAFTGWTVWRGGPKRGQFRYRWRDHDNGARTILGHSLPARLGIGHGERVIDILASHPATARFIAFKLCRRLVADEPPETVVQAAADTFLASDGEIREVVRTILLSPEFAASAGGKLKRPFELLTASLRALGTEVSAAGVRPLGSLLGLMGQVPFDWPPPNGYPDIAAAWANTNGMMNRWNLGLALAGNALAGVRTDLRALLAPVAKLSPGALTDHFINLLLGAPMSSLDRRRLVNYLADGKPPREELPRAEVRQRLPGLIALILDSPYFQWR